MDSLPSLDAIPFVLPNLYLSSFSILADFVLYRSRPTGLGMLDFETPLNILGDDDNIPETYAFLCLRTSKI